MRILVLGGTVFLGRAVTDAALARGHEVVHFHRGISAPPDARVRTVIGEREQLDAAQLDCAYDAVIDNSGYLPHVVGRSVDALRERAGRYLFVSSISVYRRFDREGFAEDSPVAPAPRPPPEATTPETYGPLKAACEAVVRQAFGERALVVRPGLIVGPHDPTDRFTYWPVRVARGGVVAAPGEPSRRVQFIDVRDLARWMVRLAERGAAGTFNATGPRGPLTMGGLLAMCRQVAGGDARFEWIDEDFLLAQGIQPWREMPLWIPKKDDAMWGLMSANIERALAAGLSLRPWHDTIRDTLEWASTLPAERPWKAGLTPAAERALLEAHAGRGAQAPRAR